MHNWWLIAALLLSLSSCSSFQRMAVGTTTPIFYNASEEMETEGNWEMFKRGAPANLKLMEGLLFIRPTDDNLLVNLTKGYAGYAFAVNETLWLEDYFTGKEDSKNKRQAIYNYTRAIEYGIEYLNRRGVKYDDLKQAVRSDGGIPAYLDQHLSGSRERDLEAVLFTAQSLAAIVNFNRTDMIIVAELPVPKGMFDWVCEKDPKINYGACDIFYGAYEAGRPAMLGGNPDKGRQHFIDIIEKQPHNWLAQIAYMQYYLIPMDKSDEFYELLENFKEYQQQQDEKLSWHPTREDGEAFENENLAVFQSMAIERYKIIKKFAESLF